MDFLNSQYLTAQDGYAHIFPQEGTFTYYVLVSDCNEASKSGVIKVEGPKVTDSDGTQYDVVLAWDSSKKRFSPRETDLDLTIRPNDFVMFQFSAAVVGQPPCFILLRGDDAVEGDSRKLKTNEVFTHFFLNPGKYAYRLGSATYQVDVADHKSISRKEHEDQMKKPLAIVIDGNTVSVPHGHLFAGQSAIWAVSDGKNVHIEKTRLELEQARPTRRAAKK
jgi:hypothetical protein